MLKLIFEIISKTKKIYSKQVYAKWKRVFVVTDIFSHCNISFYSYLLWKFILYRETFFKFAAKLRTFVGRILPENKYIYFLNAQQSFDFFRRILPRINRFHAFPSPSVGWKYHSEAFTADEIMFTLATARVLSLTWLRVSHRKLQWNKIKSELAQFFHIYPQ